MTKRPPDWYWLPTEQGECYHAKRCSAHSLRPVERGPALVAIRRVGLEPCGPCMDRHNLEPVDKTPMKDGLPDDVTHDDIDEHFGEPETIIVKGTVEVAVTIEVDAYLDDREIERKLLKTVENKEYKEPVNATINDTRDRL